MFFTTKKPISELETFEENVVDIHNTSQIYFNYFQSCANELASLNAETRVEIEKAKNLIQRLETNIQVLEKDIQKNEAVIRSLDGLLETYSNEENKENMNIEN